MNATPWTLYAAVAALALAVSLLGTPLCRWLARRLDLVDRPNEARKVHHTAIPYLGGLPFYGAFLAAAALIVWWRPALVDASLYPMAALGTVVLLLGLLDDAIGLPSAVKLVLELIIGAILYYWGIGEEGFSQPFAGLLHIGWFAPVIAALWVAGVMNAVNFSDGLDGLAGGLVFISAATLFAIGVKNGQTGSCLVMACLMGCTLGFLCFNSHPASIFMGDAGALFLGFALAGATLAVQQKGAAVIAMIVPMTALAVPIADAVLSFERRLRRARQGRFFQPDRDHLHHRLLALGLGQRKAVLAMYYYAACMGLLAFIMDAVPISLRFLLLFTAGLVILFSVAALRFLEQRIKDK